MKMVQTELGRGTSRMVTWLPVDARVKVGTILSLDKQKTRWRVLRQFITLDDSQIQRGWKVGGLF